MHVSQVMLRWYRSFNALALVRQPDDHFAGASWNLVGDETAPFVRLELDPLITTIVGANEAGKSHLLSGIAKAFNCKADGPYGPISYDKQDICRYCGFDHLEATHWPQFIIELSAATSAEEKLLAEIANSTPVQKKIWVLINGQDDGTYAAVYQNPKDKASRTMPRADWEAIAHKSLPEVRFIAANKELANEVHVQQLLDMYGDNAPSPAYDPVRLQQLAAMLMKHADPAAAEADGTATKKRNAELATLGNSLSTMTIGPKAHGQLETLLFRDVLEVPESTLKEISELASTNQPYIYRLVSDIQNRLDERLDLSRVWQQDPDLRMLVDFEGGFFYFRVTDRTGIKYSN